MSSITYHIKKQGINFSFKKLCGLFVLDNELEVKMFGLCFKSSVSLDIYFSFVNPLTFKFSWLYFRGHCVEGE